MDSNGADLEDSSSGVGEKAVGSMGVVATLCDDCSVGFFGRLPTSIIGFCVIQPLAMAQVKRAKVIKKRKR